MALVGERTVDLAGNSVSGLQVNSNSGKGVPRSAAPMM